MARPTIAKISILCAAAIALAAGVLGAATPVYVDPDAPACGGASPCFSTIDDAIAAVDNGGEVIILQSMTDSVGTTAGKTGVTIRGASPAVTLTGSVFLVTSSVSGWSFEDLTITLPFSIKNISGSLTVDGLVAPVLSLGRFTQDTSATIILRNVQLPTNDGELNILAERGYDLGGSILIEDSQMWALNIHTYVTPGDPADLTANISVLRNTIQRAANVLVNNDGLTGTGDITGVILFEDNVMAPEDGSLAVSLNGSASGNITGSSTFRRNNGSGLAVQTRASDVGGSVSAVTMEDNILQAIEIQARNAPLLGPVSLSGNDMTDRGGALPISGAYMQINGDPVPGAVEVLGTTGSEALISVKAPLDGALSGALTISDNQAKRIIVESIEGDISGPLLVSNNVLPAAADPDSSLTIKTAGNWDLAGGTVTGNQLDVVQFDIGGSLDGPLATTSNTVRRLASYIASGGAGAGESTLLNNDFQDRLYIDAFATEASFNRIFTRLTSVQPGTVAAENNWWRCSSGPGTGCATTSGVDFTPWLQLQASADCLSQTTARVRFDVLENSGSLMPLGNQTPGVVSISTSAGTLSQSSVALVGAAGETLADFPMGSAVNFTVEFDEATVVVPLGSCDGSIFSDGFETGDTSSWGGRAPRGRWWVAS